MNECGYLDADIQPACDALPIKGMETRIFILNFEDWLNATVTQGATVDIISAIALASTKEAYEAIVPPNFPKERYTSEKGDSGYAIYTHEIDVLVEPTAEGKLFAKDAGRGRFVVIAEKKAKGTDKEDAFDVLGGDAGIEGTITYDSDANDGHIAITIASPDARESGPPKTFFNTDYATTVAALEALLTPAA